MVIRVAMIADHPGVGAPNDGGVQAVTSYLVDAMCRSPEIELHILRLKSGIDRVSEVAGPGYTLHSIPIARLGTATAFRKDQSVIDRRLDEIQPDIIHSQGGGHHGVVAKRTRYPTVVTIHGILAQEVRYQQGLARKIRTRIQGMMGDHYCIRRATHTILISPYVAEYYGDSLTGKRYLIPNPVDARFFAADRNEVPGKILFAGRLNARKAVKELVQAVSLLDQTAGLQLVLAGSMGDHKYVNEVKAQVASCGLSDVVQFRGSLNLDAFLKELSQSACLVLPSYQETAPMVIQEAMACGVPVIASDICGIPYQVADGETGFLIPPGNVESLADRLCRLLSDTLARERFGAAARQKAELEYRAEAVARRTIEVYKDMLVS